MEEKHFPPRSTGVLDLQGYWIEEGDGLHSRYDQGTMKNCIVTFHDGALRYGEEEDAPIITEKLVQDLQLDIVSSVDYFLESEREA